MTDDRAASDYDAQAEKELARAAAATSKEDRKMHLDKAARHATAAELARRQKSSCE